MLSNQTQVDYTQKESSINKFHDELSRIRVMKLADNWWLDCGTNFENDQLKWYWKFWFIVSTVSNYKICAKRISRCNENIIFIK